MLLLPPVHALPSIFFTLENVGARAPLPLPGFAMPGGEVGQGDG